jgi:hypothetical protein
MALRADEFLEVPPDGLLVAVEAEATDQIEQKSGGWISQAAFGRDGIPSTRRNFQRNPREGIRKTTVFDHHGSEIQV